MSATRRRATAEPRFSLSIQHADDAGACPVERPQLRRWVRAALHDEPAAPPMSLTLRFVGEAEARALNSRYRGRDYATNVLTFPYDAGSADIVLCLPVLEREARAQRKRPADHLAHLVVHGVLHALGYDHERGADARRMQQRETAVLRRFRIADPYADA
ncbi:MAG TPA: rRNA maturation RNase YbeY [Burkholderiaceae bacterium]|nr:rRNA maturation RNase YbeY [Burkholderiaceae bacterium]